MSTQEKVIGNWNQFKGKVKQRWGQLTDDELSEVEGNFDQLVGLVQQKTGEARQQIERAINDLSSQAGSIVCGCERDGAAVCGSGSREVGECVRPDSRTGPGAGVEDAQAMVRRRPAESIVVAFGRRVGRRFDCWNRR